jgi:hypothetical protein
LDDLGWLATRSNVNQVITKLGQCATKSLDWASWRGLQFHTAKTEAALCTRKRGHKKDLQAKLTAKIRVGDVFIRFNKEATHWLRV